ncbi:hypothetical protein CEV34_4478 [Brucella pseudogrignonensis]|jgi:hypothetical protein|uniref:Uncharacterized protein n=1 Tax=Brucella pseudogrignonensis TaxID=419475 RepID=A0A256G6Q0_9HYPH|nr:hypothetical protein CEV34_4478 [Brucella pseudogrignonensis]
MGEMRGGNERPPSGDDFHISREYFAAWLWQCFQTCENQVAINPSYAQDRRRFERV